MSHAVKLAMSLSFNLSGFGGRSHSLLREHSVVALTIVAVMMSLMVDTLTFEVGTAFGIVTQQSAVDSAQDLNSLQLFLPHLTEDLIKHLQKEKERLKVVSNAPENSVLHSGAHWAYWQHESSD